MLFDLNFSSWQQVEERYLWYNRINKLRPFGGNFSLAFLAVRGKDLKYDKTSFQLRRRDA